MKRLDKVPSTLIEVVEKLKDGADQQEQPEEQKQPPKISEVTNNLKNLRQTQPEKTAPVRPSGIRTPVLDYSMGKNTPIPAAEVTQPWEKNRRPDYSIREPAVDGTIGSPQRVWTVVNRPLDLDARKGDTQKQLDDLKAKRAELEEQAKAQQEAKRKKEQEQKNRDNDPLGSLNGTAGKSEQPKQNEASRNVAAAQPYNMGVGTYQKKEETYVPGGDSKPDNTGVYPSHSYQGANAATTELSDIDKQLKELDRQIWEKETHMQTLERTERLLERGKRKAELEQVAEKEDFEKKSRYVSTALEGFWEKATSDYSMGYGDLTYEYINDTPGVRDKVKVLNASDSVLNFAKPIETIYNEFADNESDISSKGYEYMKPKEVAVYNYLYRKEGKESAEEYLDLLQETLNERKGGKIADDLEEKTLLQYGYYAYNAVDRLGRNMKNAVNVTDDYIPYAVEDFAQRDIREDLYNTGPDLPDWMGGMSLGQLGADIVDTTFSVLPSMALNMVAPGVGTAAMGVSAAGNAYQEMLNQGYTKEQARAYSTMVGFSEVGLEKFLNGVPQMGKSFMSEKVLKNLAKLDNVFGRVAKSKIGQMFFSGLSESVEEPTQNVVENMLWSAVTGEEIDIQGEELLYEGLIAFMSGGSFKGLDIMGNRESRAGMGAEGVKTPEGMEAPQSAVTAEPAEVSADAAKTERPGMELLEGFDIPKSEAMPKTEAQQQMDEAHREMMGMGKTNPVDTHTQENYNDTINIKGENYGLRTDDRAAGIGDPAQGLAGVQQSDGYTAEGRKEHGGVAQYPGVLRVSEDLQNARANRGVQSFDLYDTSSSPEDFAKALTEGRSSDQRHGWCVTPKSAQELADGNVRTVMNDNRTAGLGVAQDGDIVGVFKNKNGGPRKALDTMMPAAIEMGGDRLDCYGEGLTYVYENYGFIPVARVEFNPEYANEGWTPDKGTPYIYVMMHNGDSAADVTAKMGTYDHLDEAALNALPTYDKDSYDAAMQYRNDLIDQRKAKGKDESVGAFGGNTVGSAESGFRHEVRKSKVYENTYANAADEDVRKSGEMAKERNPRIGEYDLITEKESLHNAELRTATAEDVDAEYDYLMGKDGWTGEDNDTAFKVLAKLMESGDSERHAKLALRQREAGTTGGQLTQSFAKYSRTPEKATADAAVSLEGMDKWNVPKRFWKKQGFDAWKKGVQQSILEIGTEISKVADGDVDSMRNIVRQLANFRRTTAWAGFGSNLTRAAERMVSKLDFKTAKDIATAQLGMIPNDFRKRSKGEMINTIRIQNILSALTTTNRNLTGNAVGGLTDAVSDSTVGRFADFLLSKATGKRTIGNDVTHAKAYLKAARDAADMAALCVELDIPMEREAKYSTGKTRNYSPQSGIIGRFFSAYEKYLKYSLEVTDKFFEGGTTGAVTEGLRRLGESANLTEKEIQALGEKAGQRRTFKEGRALAKANSGLKKALNAPTKAAGLDIGAGDLLMPFAEVPAEVAQTGIDYSGAGIVEGFAEMATIIRDVRRGKEIDVLRQRKAASDFGRGVTGLTLVSAFTALAAVGILGIHNDKDKDERALDQSLGLSGAQLNLSAAIRFFRGEGTEWQDDDLLLSVDFLEPMNSQMYIGYLTAQEDSVRDMILNYPKNAGLGIVQSVLDMPMSQTLSDLANVVNSFTEVSEDGSFEPVQDAAGQLLGNIGTGFVPSWVRQTAQYIDPYYRDTSGDNAMEKAKNQVMAAIPFASTLLPKKYDGLGNVQRRYDDPVSGFFNTFVNPGKLTRMQTDEIAAYLDDLSDSTENVSIYPEYMAPKSFKVDGEEIMVSGKEMTETYQKTYGDTISDLYGALMENPEFADLPEDMQVKALLAAKGYATESAKASVSDYKASWSGEPEDMAKQIIRDQVDKRFDSAFSDLTECWKNGKDDSASVEALEEAYQVYKGLDRKTRKKLVEDMNGGAEAYLVARENGISTREFREYYKEHETYYDVEKFTGLVDAGVDADDAWDLGYLLEGLEPEKGYKNVRDVQELETIANFDGLTRKEKDIAMKMYMPDYDPKDKNPDKTELRYDYARQELKLSAEEYVEIYQAHVDNDKKAEKIAAWKALGYSNAECERFWRLFGQAGKQKIDVVEWYNGQ